MRQHYRLCSRPPPRLPAVAIAPAQARKMSTTYNTILTPKTATNPTGVNHTLTATVIRHTENCDPDGGSPQIEPARAPT